MPQFDFAVYDAQGRLRALVEAKRILGKDAEWAAQLRHNWLSHGPLPSADLVLVMPDRLFIWDAAAPDDALPALSVDASSMFAPYFERVGANPKTIDPQAFELMVAWWLEDLAGKAPSKEPAPLRLVDAVTGGQIVSQGLG